MFPHLEASIEGFLEAKRKADSTREKRVLEKKLQPTLAAAFTAQGVAFLNAFASLQSRFEESITDGDWLKLWMVVTEETSELLTIPLEEAIETALYRGALSQIAAFGLDVAFDLENERAVEYLDGNAAKLVTQINDTTRDYIKTVIMNGVRDGFSYTNMARAIEQRFASFSKPVRGPKHIRSRAELVSVTEIGNAYAEGNRIVVKDLQASGLEMQHRWLTRGDDRVSDGCRKNQAAGWIDLDEAYPSGHMRPLRFPGCRCDEQFKRKPKPQAG